MVFHNKNLLNIVGVATTKDLHAVLQKQVFTSREQGTSLSLMTAAQSRYSDLILSSTYKYVRKSDNLLNPNDSDERKVKSEAIISFLRNEVTFNDKKSIVINVRDMTAQEGLYESKAKIK